MSNYNDNNISCPLCKTIVTVPDIGAKGFEKNIYLQSVKIKAKTDSEYKLFKRSILGFYILNRIKKDSFRDEFCTILTLRNIDRVSKL
jgi:hypothetical protein